MKDLQFHATINAPKQNVWDTMLDRETYKEWTGAAWPGSDYEGTWKKDTEIRFGGPDGSGMLAKVTEFELYDTITLQHNAVLDKGGVVAMDLNATPGIEQYVFAENNGVTELTINLRIDEEWAEMFENDWPIALAKLKEVAER
ncbi:SRPBCC family protein [Mucilaginibacter myungsuensis]|uniref:SRPBCC domain-containing protein n=1 Tax=Mucilaginibacter myungsuensis TaxID=649104 RepID=A0A929KZ54_9SPHI|nr:SRPBCC domain-containing protein [Mucilaginibacter myungsuensis]MBE9663867.1 SRPBCC domain-containing protein [Mucilaginibacter myungsuensis]MDN3598418.1 SRPBCC domain-containing protein [Mucilaginibacter myungsuensis]